MRFDLHAHTFYSDSFHSPESVVQVAVKKGLDGIAITDHNQFKGAQRAAAFAKGKKITVVAGEEVMTDRGEVIGLFLKEKIEQGQFEKVLSEIRRQNGIVVFPHPCDRLRHGILKEEPELASFADALETFNARVIFGDDNKRAEELSKEFKKAETGGSDAHFTFELGSGWTEFSGEGEEGLRKAIEKRATKAGGRQSAPYVHGFGKVANVVNRLRR